jgi:guanylate kinase
MKGNLFIISSPSGGGKGTLIRRLLENTPNIGYSVSFTTRKAREGENDGSHYHFVSREEFEGLAARGEFLEHAEVHGNLYGTSLSRIEADTASGRDIILEIDVQGAAQVTAKLPSAVSIFILPPSYTVLKERLERRATEGMEDLQLRLKNSRGEVEKYSRFDYVIINDEIERASKQLQAVVLAQRAKRARQEEIIQEVLKTFDNI